MDSRGCEDPVKMMPGFMVDGRPDGLDVGLVQGGRGSVGCEPSQTDS